MNKTQKKNQMLRDFINGNDVIISPGAYDALTAKMIEKAGFKLIGTTGYGMHGSILGVPDNGLLTFNEMVTACGNMAEAVDIPILADAEDGYGNAINTIRTVQSFEKAGISGIFIEDQKLPPNCPFIKEPEVVSTEEMCSKIRAAVNARQDPNFVIVARTDAPFDEAIERAQAYIEAGADMIKILPKTRRELELIPQKVNAPLHIGFFSNLDCSDGWSAWDVGKMGYKIVTFPLTPLFLNVKAVMTGLTEIREKGTDEKIRSMMVDFAEYLKIVDVDKFRELEKKYLS